MHNLFFNHHSLPALNAETAQQLLIGVCSAIAKLIDRNISTYKLVSDIEFEATEFAPGYYFSDFRAAAMRGGRRDLFLLLARLTARHPLRNAPEVWEAIHNMDAYLWDDPAQTSKNILCAAKVDEGILISLNTAVAWTAEEINIGLVQYSPDMEELSRSGPYPVLNVCNDASVDRMQEVLDRRRQQLIIDNWSQVLPMWRMHPDFESWMQEQENEVQQRIMFVAQTVQMSNFNIGRPLVDTIHGSSLNNLKELRITVGGRNPLRVLFCRDQRQIAVMLSGDFKDGNDFYDRHIPLAEQRFS